MNATEMQLVKQAQGGDRDAFAQLVDFYKRKIYHLGFRMLGNRQEAEDMTQETFLRVHMNLNRYNPEHKFSTWIYRIGTNLCIDMLRKRRKKLLSLDANFTEGEGLDGYDFLQSQDAGPESQAILSETQQTVRQAINQLPEKYKSIIILRYLHELSLQEISDVLELPVTTIKTRVHRGRNFLRQKFKMNQLF